MGCQAAARPQRRDSVACIAYPATLAVANVQGSHHHRGVKGIIMPPTITSDVVVAYAQCPRKAYLLLYSPEQGEPHAYVRILEQQRRENHARMAARCPGAISSAAEAQPLKSSRCMSRISADSLQSLGSRLIL